MKKKSQRIEKGSDRIEDPFQMTGSDRDRNPFFNEDRDRIENTFFVDLLILWVFISIKFGNISCKICIEILVMKSR